MTSLESKAHAIHGVLALLSRAAGSDGFQVDVEYKRTLAVVMCFPYTEQQAKALHGFVQAFVWRDAKVLKLPLAGWTVSITIKEEETK